MSVVCIFRRVVTLRIDFARTVIDVSQFGKNERFRKLQPHWKTERGILETCGSDLNIFPHVLLE